MHQVSHSGIDPFLSTSFVVRSYLPLSNLWFCWNPKAMLYFELGNLASSIGEEPVPSIRRSKTSSLVSFAEQGIITFTNVLQGYNTVVLVCCTTEWEPDITCTWEGRDINVVNWKGEHWFPIGIYCNILVRAYGSVPVQHISMCIWELKFDTTAVIYCASDKFASWSKYNV